MHENGGVYAYYILVQAYHSLPPVVLDIVLQFYTELAVIVDGGESVVDFTGGKDEAVLLAVGHQNLEKFVLCHFRLIS